MVFILFDYFVVMMQKFMNNYFCSVRFDILRAIFEYIDTENLDLKKAAYYVSLLRLPIAYAKQSLIIF